MVSHISHCDPIEMSNKTCYSEDLISQLMMRKSGFEIQADVPISNHPIRTKIAGRAAARVICMRQKLRLSSSLQLLADMSPDFHLALKSAIPDKHLNFLAYLRTKICDFKPSNLLFSGQSYKGALLLF